jgi:hypothetical protein
MLIPFAPALRTPGTAVLCPYGIKLCGSDFISAGIQEVFWNTGPPCKLTEEEE